MSFHAPEHFRRAYAVVFASIENVTAADARQARTARRLVIDSWRTIRAAQTFVSPLADTLRKKFARLF